MVCDDLPVLLQHLAGRTRIAADAGVGEQPLAALLALDDQASTPVVGYRYFANGCAQTWDDGATYAGAGTTAHTRSYEWPHSLAEIIGSLLAAGLVLERFDEGKSLLWRFSERTRPVDGAWEFGPEWRDKIPCTFTIAATKPAD